MIFILPVKFKFFSCCPSKDTRASSRSCSQGAREFFIHLVAMSRSNFKGRCSHRILCVSPFNSGQSWAPCVVILRTDEICFPYVKAIQWNLLERDHVFYRRPMRLLIQNPNWFVSQITISETSRKRPRRHL